MARIFDSDKSRVLDRVQVNIPYAWLADKQAGWMEIFLENRINPEIGLDAGVLDRYGRADFSETARRFAALQRRITVHGPFLDLSAGSPDPAVRAVTRHRIDQAIDAAGAFSCRTLVCHAGYDETRYGFIRDQWYETAAETWNLAGRRLAGTGIGLMLENVYETDPEQMLRLLERTSGTGIGCCLDVGHLSVFSTVPLAAWLEKLDAHIGQLHLHDNLGKSDEHLGLGKGGIDFDPLFDWLGSTRRSLVITLEPHRKGDLQDSVRFLENLDRFSRAWQ